MSPDPLVLNAFNPNYNYGQSGGQQPPSQEQASAAPLQQADQACRNNKDFQARSQLLQQNAIPAFNSGLQQSIGTPPRCTGSRRRV